MARQLGWTISGVALACVCLTTSAAAREDFALDYERGQGAAGSCADGDALKAAVVARLGYDPFTPRASREGIDTLVVRIETEGSGLRGSIERRDVAHRLLGRTSSVTSTSGDCGELVAALAVGIAIVIDPLSLTRPIPVPPVSVSVPVPVPETSVEPAERRGADAERKERHAGEPEGSGKGTGKGKGTGVRAVVGVGPSVTVGALPQVAPALVAWAGLGWGPFEVDAGGRFSPPVSVQGAGGSVQAGLYVGTLAPCLRYRFVLGCAELSVGGLHGAGLGFDHTRQDTTLYASAGALAGAEFALVPHLALRIVVDGMVPLRPTHLVANGVVVWSTPILAGSASPTLVVSFP